MQILSSVLCIQKIPRNRLISTLSILFYQLVYLGDTSDASNLITAAKDCDLLVHESTADDSVREYARAKVGGMEWCVSQVW